MKLLKNTLLVLASTLLALALCEAVLRLLGLGGPPVSLERAGAAVADKPLDASGAMRYVSALPAAPGADRSWFLDALPPLERSHPSPAAHARFHDFETRHLFAPQSEYVWNRYFVESERCNPQGRFAGFPPTVAAFDPPVPGIYPRYRFPASTTTVSGLVTNAFGLRGRPIALAKPPRTVRIAFLGASTTVDYHYFAFSYPEYVEHWLNRYAGAAGLGVRFESLNGGREGIGSSDIAAILSQELLPLDPDLAVYYEGSNQFILPREFLDPQIPSRSQLDPKDEIVRSRLPAWITSRLVTARVLERALNGFHSAGEPRKPAYKMVWPAGIDERNPDPNHPNLPLNLSRIVTDLETMRTGIEAQGGELAVCSFFWLVRDGLPLSPVRHAEIHRQLNTFLWPLRYADAQRMAGFQNRVFRNYARSHSLPFLDVAASLPEDPDLFLDAVHLTEAGVRLKAWIVFQQLVPLVRQKVQSGAWPRPAVAHPIPAPSYAASDVATACVFPSGPFDPVPGAISVAELVAWSGVPPIEPGPPLTVTTSALQYSYAARAALHFTPALRGPLGVIVQARSVEGRIGIGIYDRASRDLQAEVTVQPSRTPVRIWVPIIVPERAESLLIRNLAPAASRIQVDGLQVVRRPGPGSK